MSSRIPLSEIPTVPLLYRTKRIRVHPSPLHSTNATFNGKIGLIRYDITKLEIDSIVNAANNSLLGGGGVDGAIHRAAGEQLFRECKLLDGCDTGDAKITNAYRLPCRKVIHAVGPVYYKEKRQNQHEVLLRGCYRRSLELCEQHELKSIAFSALSTGVYGYPSDQAAEAALSEVRNFFDEGHGQGIDRVVFCNFMQKDEDAYQEILPKYFPEEQATPAAVPDKSSTPSKPEETSKSASAGQPSANKAEKATSAAAAEVDKKLPDPPHDEPNAKKFKAAHEPLANQDENDDDWVEIDKHSIPKQASVEEVEDEDYKKKFG